jgi:hypothetical protein
VQWAPFHFQGKQYDLSHLHPKTVTYAQPAEGANPQRDYTVDVIFSLHCFTRSTKNELAPPALLYRDNREERIFDFPRYKLSHKLPAIIESLMSCKCFHTGHGNFFTVHLLDEQGNKIEYEIYFTASRSSKGGVINLHVDSAYARDAEHGSNRPHKKPIGFPIILYNTLNRLPIRMPK